MKLSMKIETPDRKISHELLETNARAQSYHPEKVITDGVSIRCECRTVREAMGFPELFNFSIYIAEHVALPIAVAFLSRYLYDKLKDKKDTTIRINDTSIEIDAEKIEQLILVILKD